MVTIMLPPRQGIDAGAADDTSSDHMVDLLILGAGWTFLFLEPLLQQEGVSYAATTTTGRDGRIPFRFDPSSSDPAPYRLLPRASTILITFPLKGTGQSKLLVSLYTETHPSSSAPNWIQLSSTGIFTAPGWNTGDSEYDTSNPRAIAEDELLAVSPAHACVLNLAGLYDGTSRDPRRWLARVAKTKAELKAKGGLHLIHGEDVARAVLAVHRKFEAVSGRRWIIADLRSYDWWELALRWGGEEYATWVGELMLDDSVRALPRDVDSLGRRLDSREFWQVVGVLPLMGIPGGKFL